MVGDGFCRGFSGDQHQIGVATDCESIVRSAHHLGTAIGGHLQCDLDAGVVPESAAVGEQKSTCQHVAVVQRAPGVTYAVRARKQAHAAVMQQPYRRKRRGTRRGMRHDRNIVFQQQVNERVQACRLNPA